MVIQTTGIPSSQQQPW